eukprot:12408431-Karenia_brevis.AAC.2
MQSFGCGATRIVKPSLEPLVLLTLGIRWSNLELQSYADTMCDGTDPCPTNAPTDHALRALGSLSSKPGAHMYSPTVICSLGHSEKASNTLATGAGSVHVRT